MVEPAVATVSICLPSIWSLVIFGFNRFPTGSIRSAWFKRSSNLNSPNRKSENSRRRNNTTPTSMVNRGFTNLVSSSSITEDKTAFVTFEQRDSPLGERPSPVSEGKPKEHRGPVTRSVELEERARDYYNRAKFKYGSRDTIEQYWDSGQDLERGPSPLRTNPLPVPPKDRFGVFAPR